MKGLSIKQLLIILLLSNGYYFDKTCHKSCNGCHGESSNHNHKWKECASNYYRVDGKNWCYSNETVEKGYYLYNDKNNLVWKECNEDCRTCNMPANSTNMNCLTCKSYKPVLMNGNCTYGCPEGEYLTLNNGCQPSCPNGSYYFVFYHLCLENCPHNYEKDDEQKKCVMKTFGQTTSLDEFKFQINENITTFLNYTSLINGSDFIASFVFSDNMSPEEQLKKGISAVDLSDCTQIIKDYYNISRNESLIILNMEYKKEELETEEEKEDEIDNNSFDLGKITHIEVFDSSGRNLNLSVCQKEIKIIKSIKDYMDELNIESAKSLSNQGIDVFNPKDDFFNDLCHKYDNPDGKDVI